MDITGIIENIELDLERNGSYDRYPVRFFSMKYAEDTANSIMKLRTDIEKISSCAVEIVDIKDFLPHEDGWVTVDNFRKQIKSLEDNKSYVMVGFSEYTRFLSNAEFITMVIGLLETENSEINYKYLIPISVPFPDRSRLTSAIPPLITGIDGGRWPRSTSMTTGTWYSPSTPYTASY